MGEGIIVDKSVAFAIAGGILALIVVILIVAGRGRQTRGVGPVGEYLGVLLTLLIGVGAVFYLEGLTAIGGTAVQIGIFVPVGLFILYRIFRAVTRRRVPA